RASASTSTSTYLERRLQTEGGQVVLKFDLVLAEGDAILVEAGVLVENIEEEAGAGQERGVAPVVGIGVRNRRVERVAELFQYWEVDVGRILQEGQIAPRGLPAEEVHVV